MPPLDAFLTAVRELLASAGLDVSPDVLRSIFWIAVAGLSLYALYHLVKFLIMSATTITGFARTQIEKKFWRNAGKMSTVISFTLLVVAYGFYGTEQTRDIKRAAIDLGREQLISLLPLAILTQWVLLCVLWVVFGKLLGMSLRALLKPIGSLLYLVAFALILALFTVSLMSVINEDGAAMTFGPLAAIVPMTYLTSIGTDSRPLLRERASKRVRRRGKPDGPVRRIVWGGTGEDISRWWVPPGYLLIGIAVWTIICGFLAAIVVIVYLVGDMSAPSLAGVITVEIIVMAVLFLLTCFRFRSDSLREVGAPPVLFHFIDLTLAMSAGAIAVAGLSGSQVTLGPIPTWLVAVGPPLIVMVAVYVFNLRGHPKLPGWWSCLAASAVAAALVLPAKTLLIVVLAPVVNLLPSPTSEPPSRIRNAARRAGPHWRGRRRTGCAIGGGSSYGAGGDQEPAADTAVVRAESASPLWSVGVIVKTPVAPTQHIWSSCARAILRSRWPRKARCSMLIASAP